MNIAIIVRKLNVSGGVQRHVLSIARELKHAGHTVILYTFILSREHCYPNLMEGLPIVSLDSLPGSGNVSGFSLLNVLIGTVRERRACRKLARLIDPGTEVLNPHDHLCYRVASWYKRHVRNIPSVWTMHDMPTKLFSLFRAQELGAAIRFPSVKRLAYRAVDWWDAHAIRGQDRIVVLDERDAHWVKQYFRREAVIVRNGIDISAFPYVPRQPLSKRRCRLLMQGIFMPHRRFEDGISALELLTRDGYAVTLSIVGRYESDNPYFKEVSALVDKRGFRDRVTFSGEMSEAEIVTQYAVHDIFLFPNHLQSWGLAVFEAMATGLPVAVSRSAGASEVLVHRAHALLVAPKSPEELAAAIAELVNTPNLYQTLSIQGRQFVESNISWARTAERMERIFSEILASV